MDHAGNEDSEVDWKNKTLGELAQYLHNRARVIMVGHEHTLNTQKMTDGQRAKVAGMRQMTGPSITAQSPERTYEPRFPNPRRRPK